MDLTLFTSSENQCFGSRATDFKIQDCSHLQRILLGVKYYRLLNLSQNASNTEIFINFYQTVYTQCLNDYQHIISVHSNQIETINAKITNDEQFDTLSARNHGKSKGLERLITDSRLSFFCELFDSIHEWLFHLFQSGMRVRQNVIMPESVSIDKNQDEFVDNDRFRDDAFARIKKEIQTVREQEFVSDYRFNQGSENSKYELNVTTTTAVENIDEVEGKEEETMTFTDSLLRYLKESEISEDIINKVAAFLLEEHFDTESLMDDLMEMDQDAITTSNIVNCAEKLPLFITMTTNYIEESNSMN